MKCKTCGFAASDASVTVCPFCNSHVQGGVAVMTAPAQAGIWPPAPSIVAPAYYLPESRDQEAIKQQRQIGILMDMGAMAAVHATSLFSQFLPHPYASIPVVVVAVGCIYPHFRGSAHWAESKGYPRRIGRLAGFLGWLGPIALALMADKNKAAA